MTVARGIVFSVLWAVLALSGGGVVRSAAADTPSDRPPRFDVEAYCSTRATGVDGFDPALMSQCVMAQGDALDHLKRQWPGVPEYIQNDCERRTRIGGEENYVLLQACVRTQLMQQQPDLPPQPLPQPKQEPPQP